MSAENFLPLITLSKILLEFLFLSFIFFVFSQGLTSLIPGKPPLSEYAVTCSIRNISPFLVGPSITLILFTSFHSLGIDSRNAFITLIVIAAFISAPMAYKIFQITKNLNLPKELRTYFGKMNDFFSAMALSILFFVQTNSSLLIDGYRTRGNNDPFDYLILGRLFENSPLAFINFHDGWYQYSDRAGPWVTRLISFIQTSLPGGRYGDFATFVFFTYFVLFIVSLKLLRNFQVQKSVALLLIYFIFTTSTMSYVFSQGFFLQVWGLIVMLEFSRILTSTRRENSVLRDRLITPSLGMFVLLTFFVYFPYVPLVLILYICLNLKNLLKIRFFRVRDFKRTSENVFKGFSARRHLPWGLIVFFFGIYFVLVLLPPIRIMSSFFIEMSSGDYGWSRSPDSYLGDGELGNRVPQGLLLSVFLILAIISVLPRKNRTNVNVGFLAFGISNLIVFTYYAFSNGLSSYQTWKYFSFLFPLAFFFTVISLNSLKIPKGKGAEFRKFYNSRFILFIVLFSFFVGKDLEGASYPDITQLNRATINAVENLKYLEEQNVGLAFSDTGTNMLLAGIVPSKSIAMLGPSYYGKISEGKLPEIDLVLTSLDLLKSTSQCSSVVTVPVFNDLVLIESSIRNRLCVSSMLQ